MRAFLTLFMLVCLFFTSCKTNKSVAHVVLNNESKQKIALEIIVRNSSNGKILKPILEEIKPGIQQIPMRALKNAHYMLQISSPDGLKSKEVPLRLDSDRWIMVTYINEDSLSIQKKFGFIDTSILKKVAINYAGIDLYIENRRPPNL